MLKLDRPETQEYVLRLEDSGCDIHLTCDGFILLVFSKDTHRVWRPGSLAERLGFALDKSGRIVVE